MSRCQRISCLLVLTVLLLSIAACSTTATPAALPETAPSTESQAVEGDQSFPILGILVLLAPAAWIIWRDARQKTFRRVKAACCLPVMDSDQTQATQK